MDNFFIMLKGVILFALLAIPGIIADKTKLLKSEQTKAFFKVLQYIALPFLVINNLVSLEFDGELWRTVGESALVGVGYTLFLYFFSIPLTAMEKEEKTRRMMRFCQISTNNGFLSIPLVAVVFPDNPYILISTIIVNIVSLTFFNTLGIYLVSGDKSKVQIKKVVCNPILIAFVLGVVLHFLEAGAFVPEISTYSAFFSGLVTPLSMLALGMKLGETRLRTVFSSWKTYYVALIKLVVVPLLVVLIALALRLVMQVSDDTVIGLFIGFTLPTATLGIAFADKYGGDAESGVAFTMGTTVLSAVTVPLVYWVVLVLL